MITFSHKAAHNGRAMLVNLKPAANFKAPRPHWLRRLWSRFRSWLLAPMPFPRDHWYKNEPAPPPREPYAFYMRRVLAAAVVVLTASSSAPATVAPPKRESALAQLVRVRPVLTPTRPYRMVVGSEVLLNGRRCRYEEVPNDAVIELLEVSTDHTIIRVHFSRVK